MNLEKNEVKRYNVQSHGGSAYADLEIDPVYGCPILYATTDKPESGISRELRAMYYIERVLVVLPNGEKVLYENIKQCWLDENDRVYLLCAKPVRSQWVDFEARHYSEILAVSSEL